MKNIIQETIEKIKDQHIQPEPKWKYLAKKYGLWALFGAVVILAALAFSTASEIAGQLDWDLYRFSRQSRLLYFLSIVPYFWVVLTALFFLAAFFEIRRTETGYRYSLAKISLVIIGGILVFGLAMTSFGLGGKLNGAMSKNFPIYGRHMMTRESQWMQPQKGFLAGIIQSVSEENLDLEDLNGGDWNISIDERTLIRPSANIAKGEMIKVIGQDKGNSVFEASEIRPWQGRGMMGGGKNSEKGSVRGMMNSQGQGKGMMRGR
jgi:hypothetical protein